MDRAASYLRLREAMVTLQDALDGDHPKSMLQNLAREMMARADDYEQKED